MPGSSGQMTGRPSVSVSARGTWATHCMGHGRRWITAVGYGVRQRPSPQDARLETLAALAKSGEWVFAPHFPFPPVLDMSSPQDTPSRGGRASRKGVG